MHFTQPNASEDIRSANATMDLELEHTKNKKKHNYLAFNYSYIPAIVVFLENKTTINVWES